MSLVLIRHDTNWSTIEARDKYLLGGRGTLDQGTAMVEGSKVNATFEQVGASQLRSRTGFRLAVRPDIIVPAILFIAALALFLPRLSVPDQYIYDEVYHAYTAGQYAAGNTDAYVWYTEPT